MRMRTTGINARCRSSKDHSTYDSTVDCVSRSEMEWKWLTFLICVSIWPSITAQVVSRKFNVRLQKKVNASDIEARRSDFGVEDPHVNALDSLERMEIGDENLMCHIITFQNRLESLNNVAGNCMRDIVFDDCCQPFFLALRNSGVYPIKHGKNGYAYCDQKTDGGGWVVVARRAGGGRSFDKTWKQYKRGFGPLDRDFWIGLDSLAQLTSPVLNTELRFDMREADGTWYHAYYNYFSVAPESQNYRLTVRGYDGEKSTIYDAFSESSGYQFSTKDHINPESRCVGFVNRTNSGWWYVEHTDYCFRTNINYIYNRRNGVKGIPWNGEDFLVLRDFEVMEMKVRPKQWRCGNLNNWEYIQHEFLNRDSVEEDGYPTTTATSIPTTPHPNLTTDLPPPPTMPGSGAPTPIA